MAPLILITFPIIAAAVAAFTPRERQRFVEYGAVGFAALEFGSVVAIALSVAARGPFRAPGAFEIDALGAFALLFASFVGLAAAIHSVGHLREEMRKGVIGFRRIREYFVLFHLFFFALFISLSTASPLVAWISIEATTLATAFLVTFYNKPSALEAGWKHLIINSAGLLIGFMGTLIFLAMAARAGGEGTFVSWEALAALAPSFSPELAAVAFVSVIVGFGTKAGLVPMHTWLPDAHSKAPVPISALLSGVLLNAAFIAVLRFRMVVDHSLDPGFSSALLTAFGLLSLMVAALIILIQKNYKRMLAYSSIEHMGIIAVGCGAGGPAAAASLLHMLYHALLKPLLFLSSGNIFLKYSSTKIREVRGALSVLPISAPIFFAALLALAALPPSGMFWTKLSILASLSGEHPYTMIFAFGAFTLVFAGFIRHASAMLFGEPPEKMPHGEASPWTLAALFLLGLAFIVLSAYTPPLLQTLIREAVSNF